MKTKQVPSTLPAPPPKPELKIKRVWFVVHAILDKQYVECAYDKYSFELSEPFLIITKLDNKHKFLVPLSNVRSIEIE